MLLRYSGINIAILIFGILGFFNPIRFVFHKVFNPIQFGFSKLGMDVRASADFVLNMQAIYMTNNDLLRENEALKAEVIAMKKYEDENIVLKNQLTQIEATDVKRNLLLANTMGNSSDLSSSTLFIDKGGKSGIKINDNVIVANYLVGIVKEVFPDRSLIELVTSPDLAITVYDIDVATKTEGLAVGQYGTSIIMQRILPNEAIKADDTIVSSGRDGIIGPGYIVGKVTKVNQVEVEPLKSAYLETSIDMSRLSRVFVVLN